jgi:effector-binding domain-containing protein
MSFRVTTGPSGRPNTVYGRIRMSPSSPSIEHRPAQAYLAIAGSVQMQDIPALADRMGEVFGFLAARGIEPAGPPFFRYHLIDMERELEMEVGVPVDADAAKAADAEAAGDVRAGTLPAGRYATVTHVGPFDELVGATADLLAWAEREGLRWDKADAAPAGERWGSRLEIYHTDPQEEPDPAKYVTELAFRLAD